MSGAPMDLLDRIQIRTWLLQDFPHDDTVILAIYGGLHDPQYTVEQEGLLGGAYYYHCEGHLPFEIACMAELDGQYVGIAVVSNSNHPKVHIYVQPQYRRNGLGRALLAAVALRRPLRGQGYRGLHNELSERLYESFGVANSRMYPVSIGLGQNDVSIPDNEPYSVNFTFDTVTAW